MYSYDSIFSRHLSNQSDEQSIKPDLILRLISGISLLVLLSVIFHHSNSETYKFEYIYYMSKILTIKSIILNNHYSEVLDTFSNGQPIGLSSGYKNYLKLVKNKNGCISNYKPCGILDTYGNALCIDEYIPCPINKVKVDHIDKSIYFPGYNSVSLSDIPYNYKLYYSNEFTDGNAVVSLIKTKDYPKYITTSNFIQDSEAFEEIFGDVEFLKKIGSVFGVEEDNKNKDDDEDD